MMDTCLMLVNVAENACISGNCILFLYRNGLRDLVGILDQWPATTTFTQPTFKVLNTACRYTTICGILVLI